MNLKSGFLVLNAIFFLAGPLASARSLILLQEGDVNIELISGPPVPFGAEDLFDLGIVVGAQLNRTKEQCDGWDKRARMAITDILLEVHGLISADEIKSVRGVVLAILSDTKYYEESLKKRFARPRPFERTDEVHPCVAHSVSNSFPSGHASVSRAVTNVLGDLFPEKRSALRHQSDQVAIERVLGGVHHPKDIEAGKALGDLVFQAYLNNDKYLKCRSDRSFCKDLGIEAR